MFRQFARGALRAAPALGSLGYLGGGSDGDRSLALMALHGGGLLGLRRAVYETPPKPPTLSLLRPSLPALSALSPLEQSPLEPSLLEKALEIAAPCADPVSPDAASPPEGAPAEPVEPSQFGEYAPRPPEDKAAECLPCIPSVDSSAACTTGDRGAPSEGGAFVRDGDAAPLTALAFPGLSGIRSVRATAGSLLIRLPARCDENNPDYNNPYDPWCVSYALRAPTHSLPPSPKDFQRGVVVPQARAPGGGAAACGRGG